MSSMHNRLLELFNSQKLGVLSTHSGGQPYASLVAFAVTEDLKQIVLVTPIQTRKYANIQADHRAALLVHSSRNDLRDFTEAIAATAVGAARQIDKLNRGSLLELYLAKHPNLQEFAETKESALICIDVDRYHVVEQFQEVYEVKP